MRLFNYDLYKQENVNISPLDFQIEHALDKITECLKLSSSIMARIGGSDFDFLLVYLKHKRNGTLDLFFDDFCRYNMIYEFNGYFDTSESPEEEKNNIILYCEECLKCYSNSDLIMVANGQLMDSMRFVYYMGNDLKRLTSHLDTDLNLFNSFVKDLNCVLQPMEYINYLTYQNRNFLKTIFSLFNNKKVLIISPFTDDIESQYEKRDKLYTFGPYKDFRYPDFVLKTLKTPITYSKYSERKNTNYLGYKDWHESLKDLKDKLSSIDFDIALLGCGSYSLPLLYEIKQLGKHGIYCGGVLQIFFGVLGSRYDYLKGSGIFNEHWIYPDISKVSISTTNLNFYNKSDGIFAYTNITSSK